MRLPRRSTVCAAAILSDALIARRQQVQTTQIAPTILHLLGLNPCELQAVQREHTQALLAEHVLIP